MEDTDMSDRPKEKDRVRSSDNGEFLGHSFEDDGTSCRNNKKHKESHLNSTDGNATPVREPSPPVGVRNSISYKDSLIGMIPGAYEHAFFGSSMEEDADLSSDEDDEGEPPGDGEVVIKFSRDLKQRIRDPWSSSLIVKVFGRSVGYVFLVNKLKSMWKAAGNFSCVDIGMGFFLVKFDSKSGFEEVLKGGPWFIGEHYLSLRPWVPNFRASEASVSSVAIWVKLPELPVEYYHKDSLLKIGSGLGPVLRVDFNTATGTRGRFARICVQLDLEQPLTCIIRVGKLKLAVVYEGIGMLCFHYGRIGHRSEWCPHRIQEPMGAPEIPPTTPDLKEDDKTSEFGPWMLVTRRKKQTKPAGVHGMRSVRDENLTSSDRAGGNANQGRAATGAAVNGRGQAVSEAEGQGCGIQLSKDSSHPLNKGKKSLEAGLSAKPKPKLNEPFIEPSPKFSAQFFSAAQPEPVYINEPIFTFNIGSPSKSSLQSQPSNTTPP